MPELVVTHLRERLTDVYRTFGFISRAAQHAEASAPDVPVPRRVRGDAVPQLAQPSHDLEEVERGGARCTRCHCSAKTSLSRRELEQPGPSWRPTPLHLYRTCLLCEPGGTEAPFVGRGVLPSKMPCIPWGSKPPQPQQS